MLKVPRGGVPSLQSFLRTQRYQFLSKKILLNAHTKFILGFADSVQQGKRQQCSCEHGALATGPSQGDHGVGSASLRPPSTSCLKTLPPVRTGLGGLPRMDLQSLLKHLSVLEAPVWPRRDTAPCFRWPEDIAETEREDLPQGPGLTKVLLWGQQPFTPHAVGANLRVGPRSLTGGGDLPVPQMMTRLPGVIGASRNPLAPSDTPETVCLTIHK